MTVIISEKKGISHVGLFDIRIDWQRKLDRYVMY
jgi:hypothetical protein